MSNGTRWKLCELASHGSTFIGLAPHPQMQKNCGFHRGHVGGRQLAQLGAQALLRGSGGWFGICFWRLAVRGNKGLARFNPRGWAGRWSEVQRVNAEVGAVV